MTARRVLITGAAGRIGSTLAPRLAASGHHVTALDRTPVQLADVQCVQLDLADAVALAPLLTDHDALVHLAGELDAEDWDALEGANITLTRRVFAQAADAGVETIIYASSIHAGGYAPLDAHFAPTGHFAPDSPYGVSKRCGEAILELIAARASLEAYALRIGTCRATPLTIREAVTWLSPDDASRLVEACLGRHGPGYRTIWAFSANSTADIDRRHWQAIGYAPCDDAERHRAELSTDPVIDGDGFGLIGGRFVKAR